MTDSETIIGILCGKPETKTQNIRRHSTSMFELAEVNRVLSPLSFLLDPLNMSKIQKESILLADRDRRIYKETLNRLLPIFRQNDIEPILLKGLSLAGEVPRDMGDMDLLIDPDELKTSITILESEGFVYTGGDRGYHKRRGEAGDWDRLLTWSNQFEFLHADSGLLIELHTNLFQRFRLYRFNLDPLLDRIGEWKDRSVYSDELGCRILSLEDRILLLAVHNSIKRSATTNSFALRNILDMKYLIESGTVNWSLLLDTSEKTESLMFLVYTLEMTRNFYPGFASLDSPIQAGNRRLTRFQLFFKRIMHSCYRSLEYSHRGGIFLYNLLLPFAQRSRLKTKLSSLLILPVILPPPWKLRLIYGLPRYSPLVVFTYLLEPIRWCRVFIREYVLAAK